MEIIGKPEDYHISGFTAKTGSWSSAYKNGVEVIHLPTGIKAVCDTERNQHANREKCLAEIKEKLTKQEQQVITNIEIDAALDAVLVASGSALKHYTMPSTKEQMRHTMLQIMKKAYVDGSNACHRAMQAK